MNTNTEAIKTILVSQTKEFIEYINKFIEIGPFSHKDPINYADFPLFQPASAAFFRYRVLEEYLENGIRKYLISDVIRGLLSLNEVKADFINEAGIAAGSKLSLRGERIPFEFIVPINGDLVGVRYVGTYTNNEALIDACLELQIAYVLVLDFCAIPRKQYSVEKLDNTEIEIRTSHYSVFFQEQFGEEAWLLYYSEMKTAVAKANQIIGFNTIRQLSPQKLSEFKSEIVDDIIKTLSDYKIEYIFATSDVHGRSLTAGKMEKLLKHIINEKLYLALIGEADFAKCFVTAEYLYLSLQNENGFDYTSVICGYLKAVEELVYTIFLSAFEGNNTKKKLWDGMKSSKFRKREIRRLAEHPDTALDGTPITIYLRERNIRERQELGTLISIIQYNDFFWRDDSDKIVVCSFLDDFRKFCRNEHFHKDNIYDTDTVNKIRNNAIVCLLHLLGSVDWSERGYRLLKMTDDVFDRLFRKIAQIPIGITNFIAEYNGKQIKMIRKFQQPEQIYAENGLIISDIVFYEVNSFKEDYCKLMEDAPQNRVIRITRDWVPARMWYVSGSNEKEIVW